MARWLLGAGLEVVCIDFRANLMAALRYKAPGNVVALCQEKEAGLVVIVNERQNGKPRLDDPW